MAIELMDDGTFDTVLRCDICREEFRYTYAMDLPDWPRSTEDAQIAQRTDEAAYDMFVTECIAETEADHICYSTANEGLAETGDWFDERGNRLRVIPADCITDCSSSGSVDGAVAYWLGVLAFSVPRERAIAYLQGFGAWPMESDDYDTGLLDMDDNDLASKVLWLACCDIRETGEWFGLQP
ncbi:MAG: hypothetical protein E6R03_13685 [Hyphomicrobiaceae bacterium]|nr:MAG: hypothetical protein E6R03_13685 [Hyphomicrobiaceae bacterium]